MLNPNSNFLDIDDVLSLGAEEQSRRKSQTTKEPMNYTNRAIVSFVDAVDKMNEEVLIPSRLKDLEVRETDATELMPVNSDLFSFYQLLNTVRKDLFSSSLFHKSFQPVSSGNNSGQNSGRVTPISNRSRRSSYSMSNGHPLSNGNSFPNGRASSPSPTLLAPPNGFVERKLSNPCPMNGSNDLSPDSLAQHLIPQLSLSFVHLGTSLSSLLDAAGHRLVDPNDNEGVIVEDRIHQITSCFMYHLSAIYTMMGHFTKTANYIVKRYHEQMENVC
ncbi:hypothetical protein SSS_04509 [Sarcoptes scabiei]|uniref:Mid1-interacting protein 1-like protein n=1 Tax=Sarcoptes scabiei TaxID=52283 RepID=A0A834RGH1_SARSC|nr:hypothetical protein SSS_04509 [Sarcoptes scabiei]